MFKFFLNFLSSLTHRPLPMQFNCKVKKHKENYTKAHHKQVTKKSVIKRKILKATIGKNIFTFRE